ncbi:MAG: hypothetical protein Q9216_004326 [Gyalolechia sp. 2 TL-2023]
MGLYLLALAYCCMLVLGGPTVLKLAGPESDVNRGDGGALRPRDSVAGLASPSLESRGRNDRDIIYKVPGTDTTVDMTLNLDTPLSAGATRDLLSRAILEVELILEISGDGPVPSQDYDKEIGSPGRKIRVSVFGGQTASDVLTYGIVKDTLNGLWDQMVVNRLAFRMYAIVTHGSVGIVAHALLSQPRLGGQIADA